LGLRRLVRGHPLNAIFVRLRLLIFFIAFLRLRHGNPLEVESANCPNVSVVCYRRPRLTSPYVENGDFGDTLDVSTFLSSFLAFFAAFFAFFAAFNASFVLLDICRGR
jgi:hypothetical protein